jgi:hypothetical protein
MSGMKEVKTPFKWLRVMIRIRDVDQVDDYFMTDELDLYEIDSDYV